MEEKKGDKGSLETPANKHRNYEVQHLGSVLVLPLLVGEVAPRTMRMTTDDLLNLLEQLSDQNSPLYIPLCLL